MYSREIGIGPLCRHDHNALIGLHCVCVSLVICAHAAEVTLLVHFVDSVCK